MTQRSDRQCTRIDCTGHVKARGLCTKHYARLLVHGDPDIVLVKIPPWGAPRKFLEAIPAAGDGCLRWPFGTNGVGYAQINIGRKKLLVSRLVCERYQGAPPTPRHVAAHSCGKGHQACVAPWHLTWKTHRENSADMITHGTLSCGERHHSKLTAAQVQEIRTIAGTEAQTKIAQRFGVSQGTITRIVTGKAWRHLPRTEAA